MIDQILGRPSPTIRRHQILLVLFFWLWRLYKGDGAPLPPSRTISAAGPRPSSGLARASRRKSWAWKLWVALVGRRAVTWMARINDRLSKLSTPHSPRRRADEGEHFTPYQLILGTLTVVYALRHVGDIFGLGSEFPCPRDVGKADLF